MADEKRDRTKDWLKGLGPIGENLVGDKISQGEKAKFNACVNAKGGTEEAKAKCTEKFKKR